MEAAFFTLGVLAGIGAAGLVLRVARRRSPSAFGSASAARLRDLETALARRDAVVAMLGHELRGPLRSLLGLLDREPPTGRREAMRRTVAHALRLAEDGLAWGRLAGGPVPLRNELVVDVAPALAARWEGDAGRLRQILTNLLINALDHTREGHVVLEVAQGDPQGLELAVRDSGPGIPFAQRERIFEPFVQGGDSPGQAGLGLAIVDELVRALGGALACEAAPDRGMVAVINVTEADCGAHFWEPLDACPSCASDEDHAVAEKYGAWGLKKFMGREFMGVLRTTFIIGKDGRLKHVMDKVKTKSHHDDVIALIKELGL